ncbi:MAG: chemotaxis protein [Deltaproteobacteria bacterium RIFOXYD12_FULL_50_9]|nr:MAG: chemotaxis protein [Deltaproteobacteria bacterium RIFOXYD12_FULL_50_9]
MAYYKRKKLNLKVKRDFQKWLLARILGVVVLSSLLAALILYFYSYREITDSYYDAHIKIRRVSDLLLPVVLAGSFISLISGMLLALFLPQKIAGPIYRIETDLQAVRDGDLTLEIHLRKNDILTDFVTTVNSTVFSLKDSLTGIKKTNTELEQAIADNNQNKIKELFAKQRQALDFFKVE